MGFKLILSVSLLLSTATSNRALGQENDVNLLTYSELMQLPVEKRVLYIEDVQKMLVEISKSPGRFSDSDPKSRSKLKVWLELMQTQIAFAADDGIPRCEHEPTGKCFSAMTKCDQKDFDVKWDGKAYVCDTSKKIVRNGPMNRRDSFVERLRNRNDPQVEANSTKEALPVQLKAKSVQNETVVPVQSEALTRGLLIRKPSPPSTIEAYVRAQSEKGSLPCKSIHQSASPLGWRELPECTPAGEAAIKSAFEKQSIIAGIFSKSDGESTAPSALAKLTAAEPAVVAVAPAVLVAEPQATVEPATEPPSGTVSFPVAPPVIIDSVELPASRVKTTGKEISSEISPDEIRKLLLEKRNPDFLCIEEAKKAGTGKMKLIEYEVTGRRFCMTEKGEQLSRDKKWRPEDVDDRLPSSREARMANTGKPSASVPAAPALSCAPKPVVCPDPKVSKAQAFAGNQKCVFAGMLSELDKRNVKCEAFLELKISDTTYKCDAGQAMCNPLLFGVVSPTKPICVGRGQDATLQCSKLSSARDAEKFINRNATGIQDKWDEFGRGLKSLCKADTISAKFHCVECNIMQMRIFEMNARAIASLKGDPCSPASIGKDAVGERMKSRSTAPVQNKNTAK